MVAPIKRTVTVQHDGRIEIHAPELRAGARAEVIVQIQEAVVDRGGSQLEALDALQEALRLDENTAAEWMKQVREERASSGPPE